jgi:hypothetical protein
MSEKTEIFSITLGEKSILAAILNILRNNDLISRETLDEAFEKLGLSQEYKEICEVFLAEQVNNINQRESK